ncbi:MAG: molecular chaperone [Sphingomonadales bacterium]|nr:molecular chaperone [Sphingomonadales bacterium]
MRGPLSIVAATVASLFFALGVLAGSLTVNPVRIVLTPEEPVQTMRIQNTGSDTSRIQLRLFAWRQEGGKDVFEETRDVLVNPGLFEIGAKGEQIARFGLRTSPGTTEKSYRVFVEEVPDARLSQPGVVRTLLRISIPIFLPAHEAIARLDWRLWTTPDNKSMVSVSNTGAAHVQISGIVFTRGATKLGATAMSVYLLPGASQQISLNLEKPIRAGDAVKLEATTDQARFTADLVAESNSREAGRP